MSLHLEFEEDKRKVIVTTTLVVVLFTTIVLGGGTMPLMKYMESRAPRTRNRRKRSRSIALSKTAELGAAVESEYLSELTESEMETTRTDKVVQMNRFMVFDIKYFRPFFTRRFTQKELKEGRSTITELTEKWYHDIQASPANSEIDIELDQD